MAGGAQYSGRRAIIGVVMQIKLFWFCTARFTSAVDTSENLCLFCFAWLQQLLNALSGNMKLIGNFLIGEAEFLHFTRSDLQFFRSVSFMNVFAGMSPWYSGFTQCAKHREATDTKLIADSRKGQAGLIKTDVFFLARVAAFAGGSHVLCLSSKGGDVVVEDGKGHFAHPGAWIVFPDEKAGGGDFAFAKFP